MFRRPRPTHDVQVVAVTPLTPALLRLTLAGPTLDTLTVEHPTQWVKLATPDGHSRAYTIRHHRPAERETDIDIVLHGNGPLSRWAASARTGDQARIMRPRAAVGRPSRVPGTSCSPSTRVPFPPRSPSWRSSRRPCR